MNVSIVCFSHYHPYHDHCFHLFGFGVLIFESPSFLGISGSSMDLQMNFDPSHSSEIIAYYYSNYTECPEDTNYFSTWQFVSGFLHAVFMVQSPLVVFTGYCIIKKTPKVMGSLKWAMLNVHFWSTYMDVFLCTLTTPYLIFPAIAGFPLGLLRWLGVPTLAQSYLTITSIGFMLNSISALFENRSSSFEVTRFRFTRTSSRLAFFTFNGIVTSVFLYPVFDNLPDQNQAKMKLLKVSMTWSIFIIGVIFTAFPLLPSRFLLLPSVRPYH